MSPLWARIPLGIIAGGFAWLLIAALLSGEIRPCKTTSRYGAGACSTVRWNDQPGEFLLQLGIVGLIAGACLLAFAWAPKWFSGKRD
ncbi:hypothetical protein [Bosea caraganae]|uniref:hypothetical protein n=1 Tax=Bosea caraganae TaxID=2763117 RepID=UPI0011C05359|nr:hypothetical protein [Bosea caraganae]